MSENPMSEPPAPKPRVWRSLLALAGGLLLFVLFALLILYAGTFFS